MNIFSLINSKDIREYLKANDYNFSTLETAWLVYACRRLSYEEKKKYWNEIVSTMPDCEVPSWSAYVGCSSLHLFLAQYMKIIDLEIKDFLRTKLKINMYICTHICMREILRGRRIMNIYLIHWKNV